MDFIQDFLLSQWLIVIALVAVLLALSYWSIRQAKQYKGLGLGFMMGFFFIIVRLSIADADAPVTGEVYLDIFQVFVATLFGIGTGIVIMFAFRAGSGSHRQAGIQVAIYTAVLIILAFLAVISNPVVQKMIGIYAFTVGMATMLVLLLAPENDKVQHELNISPRGVSGTQRTSPHEPMNQGQGGAQKNILQKARQPKKWD